MKTFTSNYKLPLYTFGFLLFFITSCTKEDFQPESIPTLVSAPTTETEVSQLNINHSTMIYLPKGYENLPEDKLQVYLAELPPEERSQLNENYVLVTYLEQLEKKEEVEAALKQGQTFLDIDLAQFLTPVEIQAFENFDPAKMIVNRSCTWYAKLLSQNGSNCHYRLRYLCQLKEVYSTYSIEKC